MHSHKNVLIKELKSLKVKRPPESAPATTLDEYFLRLQELYTALLLNYPSFAIEQKLELEMWNSLYKSQIDSLLNSLNQPFPGTPVAHVGNSFSTRSKVELKMRLVLLLDRATGVYLNLVHRLLASLPDSSWLKWLFSSSVSPATPLGAINAGGHAGRFDLDLTVFSVRNSEESINATDASVIHLQKVGITNWLASLLHCQPRRMATGLKSSGPDGSNAALSSSFDTAPRILSRGDRLPTAETEQGALADASEGGLLPPKTGSSSSVFPVEVVEEPKPVSLLEHISAVQYLVQHCLVHLGDISRYRRQSNVAAGYYIWAWLVQPESGHPYNQLAVLEMRKRSQELKLINLFYYYVRAIACEHSFPAALTNLQNLLSSPLCCSSGLSDSNQDKLTRPVSELLVQVYAGLHVPRPGHEKLCHFARELHAACTMPTDDLSIADQELIRLAVVHVFVANDRILKAASVDDLESSPDVAGSEEETADTDQLVTQFEARLMAQVTVDLVNWLSLQCQQSSSTTSGGGSPDCQGHSSAGSSMLKMIMTEDEMTEMVDRETLVVLDVAATEALGAVNLVFLWLRQIVLQDEEFAPVLDGIFSEYATSFSDDLVSLLNHLLLKQPQALTQAPKSTGGGGASSVVDWATVMGLPEISCLQGFLPLGIPTHSKLHGCWSAATVAATAATAATRPGRPAAFPAAGSLLANYLFQVMRSQRDCPAIERSSEFEVFGQSVAYFSQLRIVQLLQSAKVIATRLPSLLGTESSPANERFVPVGRASPQSDPFVAPPVATVATATPPVAAAATPTAVANTSLLLSGHSDKENAENPGPVTVAVAKETVANGERASVLMEIPTQQTTEARPHGKLDLSASPIPGDPRTTTTSATAAAETRTSDSDVSVLLATPTSTRRDEGHPATAAGELVDAKVTPTSTEKATAAEVTPTPIAPLSNCGGLIFNSELAKFIQEQANQVAARQKRANGKLTSDTGLLPLIDDDLTRSGRSPATNSATPFTAAGLARGNGSSPAPSRLSLSASFRRDLPPRFAKRLQAELMEREAAAAVGGGGGDARRTLSTANGMWQAPGSHLLPLDRPAPLARKESEAPYELSTLLCSTINNNTNSTLTSNAVDAENQGSTMRSLLHGLERGPLGAGHLGNEQPLFFQASATNNDTAWAPTPAMSMYHPPHLPANYLPLKDLHLEASAPNLLDWRSSTAAAASPRPSATADQLIGFNAHLGAPSAPISSSPSYSSFLSSSSNNLFMADYPLARAGRPVPLKQHQHQHQRQQPTPTNDDGLANGLYSVLLDDNRAPSQATDELGHSLVAGSNALQQQQHWLMSSSEQNYLGRMPATDAVGQPYSLAAGRSLGGFEPVSARQLPAGVGVGAAAAVPMGQQAPASRSSYGYTTTVP